MNSDIENMIAGRAGLAGVRRALLDPQQQEVLLGALASLLPAADLLIDCRLHRAKYKPGRHLTAYHEVTVHNPAQGAVSTRQIEVTWMPEGAPDPRGAGPDLRSMQDDAASRGLVAPFRELLAEVPDQGMRVQVAPLDVRFPQLVRVSEPGYVRDMLVAAGVTEPSGTYRVTAIRYRPGQRHVLRYTSGAGTTMFAKVYNSDKGQRIFSVVTQVADWLAAQDHCLRTIRPHAYVTDDGVVLYPLVSGTPLSELLRARGQDAAAHLRDAGAALRALHSIPTTLVELQPHTLAKEMKGIASASEHVHTLQPMLGAKISAILERARALHERLPQEPPGFTYGDFKADHLWATPDGLTLIDFDTCYLFDQAIDVGKFLADLRWWYDGYGFSGVEQAQQQFLAGYAPDVPPERLLRGRLYEVLVLLKTTVRRVRLFDTDWEPRTDRLIQQADALLRDLEIASG